MKNMVNEMAKLFYHCTYNLCHLCPRPSLSLCFYY